MSSMAVTTDTTAGRQRQQRRKRQQPRRCVAEKTVHSSSCGPVSACANDLRGEAFLFSEELAVRGGEREMSLPPAASQSAANRSNGLAMSVAPSRPSTATSRAGLVFLTSLPNGEAA